MPKFRKKPVEIEAMQFDGSFASAKPILAWMDGSKVRWTSGGTGTLLIDTLEGEMTATPGDWIIKGVKGEFYPCKHDIFEQTYEAVDHD